MTDIIIPQALISAIKAGQSIVALTGAGISAESGIPTFRDSQTGIWEQYDPQELATPEAFARNPDLVLQWYQWRRELINQAKPNPGHYALSELEKRMPKFTLITQNVDGLHTRAGSQNIIELHGNIHKIRCSQENCQTQPVPWVEGAAPRCPVCGSLMRPDVVWFGEPLAKNNLTRALAASQTCDIFLSIGTSGIVEPAASLPYHSLRTGSIIVEINPNPTLLNDYAHFYFSEPSGQVLPAILETVRDG